MIPVYCVCGIVYGMVELIRRVIPRDIVGGHINKLKRMDSLVRGRCKGVPSRYPNLP
jgi:hypothetical protein